MWAVFPHVGGFPAQDEATIQSAESVAEQACAAYMPEPSDCRMQARKAVEEMWRFIRDEDVCAYP
jgi:hypothetical protein